MRTTKKKRKIKPKKKKVILFGEKLILFGFVWSLPQKRVKGNSEDLLSKKYWKKKKIKKGKEEQKRDWGLVMWLTCVYLRLYIFWKQYGGGAPRSENIKLLFNQQPDMTDDSEVPCEKSACPPEKSSWLRAVGRRNERGMGQEVKFLRYKVMPTLLFVLTGSVGHFRQRSPTNCPSAPLFVKKAGG